METELKTVMKKYSGRLVGLANLLSKKIDQTLLLKFLHRLYEDIVVFEFYDKHRYVYNMCDYTHYDHDNIHKTHDQLLRNMEASLELLVVAICEADYAYLNPEKYEQIKLVRIEELN